MEKQSQVDTERTGRPTSFRRQLSLYAYDGAVLTDEAYLASHENVIIYHLLARTGLVVASCLVLQGFYCISMNGLPGPLGL